VFEFVIAYARANIMLYASQVLLHSARYYDNTFTQSHLRFSTYSREVKLSLFRAHYTQFYGAELWKCFHTSVVQRSEAAYVKCLKMFFDFSLRDSVIVACFIS